MNHVLAIVGHESRRDMIQQLIASTNPFFVTVDDGDLGCFQNHRKAWETLAKTATTDWAVVLEDDAVPVPGFLDQLDAALAQAPSPVVSLYIGRGRPRMSQPPMRELVSAGVDTSWLLTDEMLGAVGIAIHTDLITRMLKATIVSPAVWLPIDYAIGEWARQYGVHVAYTWPSLVNHADTQPAIDVHPDGQPRGPIIYTPGTDVPRLQRRVAWRVGTRDRWDSTTTWLELMRGVG